jgi:hypothetical protein
VFEKRGVLKVSAKGDCVFEPRALFSPSMATY